MRGEGESDDDNDEAACPAARPHSRSLGRSTQTAKRTAFPSLSGSNCEGKRTNMHACMDRVRVQPLVFRVW